MLNGKAAHCLRAADTQDMFLLATTTGSGWDSLCQGWYRLCWLQALGAAALAYAQAGTLSRFLQALAAAETAYAKAMTAISHVPLAAERDGDTLRAALNAFSDLPQAVAQTHSTLQIGMSTVTRSLHEVVTELRWE